MAWVHRFFRRPPRAGADEQLDEEIRFYLAQETQLRIDRGESPEQARAAARRDFGNVTLVKETTRRMRGSTMVEDVARDLRHSVRLLSRSPAFTVIAVLSLALGIGATTTIFALSDAVMFRSLPVRDPGRLVQVRTVDQRGANTIYSYPHYLDVAERTRVFSATACAGSWAIPEPIVLKFPDGSSRDVRARLTAVSGNYFSVLGVEPTIGRAFTAPGVDEERPSDAPPVAILSFRFWRQAFDASPSVLQSTLQHNGAEYQIVGVAPRGFTGISSNDDPDVWVPTHMMPTVVSQPASRSSASLYVFGRLKPGVSTADASTDLARVYEELRRIHGGDASQRGDVIPMAKGVQTLRERFEMPLLVLLGFVGLLLLVACVNIASLLLARASARRHEIAVRLSLGASRWRLVRQFFTESLLLAALGGAAGLLVSGWSTELVIELATTSTRRLPIHFAVDYRILLFTIAVSTLTALMFGLLPAFQGTRSASLLSSSSTARTPSRLPAGRVLIVGQMALSLFLLIAAGLFVRSLSNLRGVDTGFVRENVLVLMLDARAAFGNARDQYLSFYQRLAERVEALPGVQSASLSSASFFGNSSSRGNIAYEGHAGEAPRNEWPLKVRITPRFPETFGLTLLAGRTFTDRDDPKVPVAIVSESIATRYFPGDRAIGKHLCFSSSFALSCAIEIVGIVRDVRYSNLREASPYVVYLPVQQDLPNRADLQVRTLMDPAPIVADVQKAVRDIEPRVRIVHSVSLERLVEDSIIPDRLLALFATFFAVLALVLSTAGLYGVTSYGVHRRTRELGVRMALGASGRSVQWMVLREVLVLGVIGAAVGVAASLASARVVRGLLFGVVPTDPLIVAGATMVLILVATVAGFVPARRACRVDPMRALRCE
jgi:predicted permease